MRLPACPPAHQDVLAVGTKCLSAGGLAQHISHEGSHKHLARVELKAAESLKDAPSVLHEEDAVVCLACCPFCQALHH